jgi:hypothetical protein
MAYNEIQVGPKVLADGAIATARGEKSGSLLVTDAHGRFQEAAYRGALFSAGMTATSIANVTFTTATTGATATPIIGVWNPLFSGKNLVILQARVQLINTNATTTSPGAFMWMSNTGQSAISTGIVPLSRLSLVASGSVAKGFANTALTGMTGALTVQEASGLQPANGSNYSQVGTAAGFAFGGVELVTDPIDGAFIVPPGGVLGLFCTTTPVAVSAASSILWEEISL